MNNSDRVPEVQALSRQTIEFRMERFLAEVAPKCLKKPQPIPILEILDRKIFQKYGFAFRVSDSLEPGCDGETDFGRKTVTVNSNVYEQLERDVGRARFTGGHEATHVILHSAELCPIGARLINGKTVHLQRKLRSHIPTFRDPEWQANFGAGALLMPKRMVMIVTDGTKNPVARVSEVFKVSPAAAEVRLKKLSLIAA